MRTIKLFLFTAILVFAGQSQAQPTSSLEKAKLLVANNKTREAIPVLEGLIKKDSEAAPHNYFLGVSLVKEGIRIEEAIKYLEKAAADYSKVDLDPGMGEPEFVWYYLTIGYSRLKACAEAKDRYDKFVEVYSKRDPFYTNEAVKWITLCHEPMRMAQELKSRKLASDQPYLKDRLTLAAPTEDEIITRDVNYTTRSVLYGVQVSASLKPAYTTQFKGLKNVGVYVDENKVYRYVIGNLTFRTQAEELLKEVRNIGYPGAFIVDINQPDTYGEEVTSLNDLSINPNIRGKVEFRVQLGAFAETLPKDLRKFYFKIDDLKTVREGDFTIMTTGKFDSYKEAQAHRDMLQKQGLDDCFVTAFNRRKRIPVKVALDYMKQDEKEEIIPQKRGKK